MRMNINEHRIPCIIAHRPVFLTSIKTSSEPTIDPPSVVNALSFESQGTYDQELVGPYKMWRRAHLAWTLYLRPYSLSKRWYIQTAGARSNLIRPPRHCSSWPVQYGEAINPDETAEPECEEKCAFVQEVVESIEPEHGTRWIRRHEMWRLPQLSVLTVVEPEQEMIRPRHSNQLADTIIEWPINQRQNVVAC